MEIRFWGVRGSLALSGSRIGGNTSCVEVVAQGERLILDAGTGIRALGEELARSGSATRAAVCFSHLHWDHVQGFPFFTPAYQPGSALTLVGPGVDGERALRAALERQMEPPGFPVPFAAMRASFEFRSAVPQHVLEHGPFRITPFEVPHPQGCISYRIEADGRSFVFMTDVELRADAVGEQVLAAVRGADVLCLDAQYTPDEYEGRAGPSRRGWGHSTMVEAAKLAALAGVGRLILFHHDPAHSDEQVENMAEVARGYFPISEPAREGNRVVLAPALARCA